MELVEIESKGSAGIAADVRYYGNWMRAEAFKRIGALYPEVRITEAMAQDRPDLKNYVGRTFKAIAFIWTRTVNSPNPAFSHVEVPLASTFMLISKPRMNVWVEPIFAQNGFTYTVRVGEAPSQAQEGTKVGRGGNFKCLISGTPISVKSIREAGQQKKLGIRLMALVAEGPMGRVYVTPSSEDEEVALSAKPRWRPELSIANNPRDIRCHLYGLETYGDLFTNRQLAALTTFSDLLAEAKEKCRKDALINGMADDDKTLESGGRGARAYSEAVALYLGCALSRLADYNNAICTWNMKGGSVAHLFARQAIPMSWDFIEVNPLEKMSGNWDGGIEWVSNVLDKLSPTIVGHARQGDAAKETISWGKFISTDPPYYDNVGYADLSDFFYVWLRKSLREIFPALLSTIAVPKAEELVATPNRHGSKEEAENFFLQGMTSVLQNLAEHAHPASPVTIFYAFKQAETKGDETNSTGWETFLDAVLSAGFSISGTWPMRTERPSGVKTGTNSLASSVVLVCRPRGVDAGTTSRRQFIRELNAALPLALDAMTRESEGLHSPVAPVDLSQAIIGPGMSVFSKYSAVLEADGTPMTVRTALQLINRFLAEDDFDADTQFCLHWFEQYGWESGKFGDANTLAQAKGTSVDGVKQSGVLHAAGGNVRLLKWAEYSSDWDPQSDQRLPIWEVLHQLIRVFNTDGETGAAAVFAAVQSKAEAARQLAYRLYTLCERKNWAEDARAYNEVVTSWSGIEAAAAKEPSLIQRELFDN